MADIFDEFRRLRREMHREMNRMFDDLFDREFFERAPLIEDKGDRSLKEYRTPVHDITETEKDVFVTAELPGVDKKDIDINISDEFVEIRVDKETEKKDKENYVRARTAFYKKVALPTEIIPDKAEATYKNGVLEIKIPKKKESKTKKLEVK